MLRRLFTLASALSLPLCITAAVLWPVSHLVDMTADGLRLFHRTRVGVFNGDISFYNGMRLYSGSIVAISSVSGPPPAPAVTAFDFAGLYFRRFTWPGGTYWTLTIPLLYPFLLSAALPAFWTIAYLRRSPLAKTCRRCGYDLRATPDRCPECGEHVHR